METNDGLVFREHVQVKTKNKIVKPKADHNSEDKDILDYISLICEEEDINTFCSFNEKYEVIEREKQKNKHLYNSTYNLKYDEFSFRKIQLQQTNTKKDGDPCSFKHTRMENIEWKEEEREKSEKEEIEEDRKKEGRRKGGYKRKWSEECFTFLMQNEQIQEDEQSCCNISYLYKTFLHFSDFCYDDYQKDSSIFPKNFERDIFYRLLKRSQKRMDEAKKIQNDYPRKIKKYIFQKNTSAIKNISDEHLSKAEEKAAWTHLQKIECYPERTKDETREEYLFEKEKNTKCSAILILSYVGYSKLQNEFFDYFIPNLDIDEIVYFKKHLERGKDRNFNFFLTDAYRKEKRKKHINMLRNKERQREMEAERRSRRKKKDAKIKNKRLKHKNKNDVEKKKKIDPLKEIKLSTQTKVKNTNIHHDAIRLYCHDTNDTSGGESSISFSRFLPCQNRSKHKKKKKKNYDSRFSEKNENDLEQIFKDILSICQQNKVLILKNKVSQGMKPAPKEIVKAEVTKEYKEKGGKGGKEGKEGVSINSNYSNMKYNTYNTQTKVSKVPIELEKIVNDTNRVTHQCHIARHLRNWSDFTQRGSTIHKDELEKRKEESTKSIISVNVRNEYASRIKQMKHSYIAFDIWGKSENEKKEQKEKEKERHNKNYTSLVAEKGSSDSSFMTDKDHRLYNKILNKNTACKPLFSSKMKNIYKVDELNWNTAKKVGTRAVAQIIDGNQVNCDGFAVNTQDKCYMKKENDEHYKREDEVEMERETNKEAYQKEKKQMKKRGHLESIHSFLTCTEEERKKDLKRQILKGINETDYDPLFHLEHVVDNMYLLNALERDQHLKNEKPKLKNPLQKSRIPSNSYISSTPRIWKSDHATFTKEDVMNEGLKKKILIFSNIDLLKFRFCSLYINGKYSLIELLYKYEYIFFDFYITVLFIKSLIKLKKYEKCIRYIFDINEENEVLQYKNTILYYFQGICYRKLKKYKISKKHFYKAIVDTLIRKNQMITAQNQQDEGAVRYKCTYYISEETTVLPFIFSCLDKLIGTYQLKSHEEIMLIKYVKLYFDVNKYINYYISQTEPYEYYDDILLNFSNITRKKGKTIDRKKKKKEMERTWKKRNQNMLAKIFTYTKSKDMKSYEHSTVYQQNEKIHTVVSSSPLGNSLAEEMKKKFKKYYKIGYKGNSGSRQLEQNNNKQAKSEKRNNSNNLSKSKNYSPYSLEYYIQRGKNEKKKKYSFQKYLRSSRISLIENKRDKDSNGGCSSSGHSCISTALTLTEKKRNEKIIMCFDKIIKRKWVELNLLNIDDFFVYIFNKYFNRHNSKFTKTVKRFVKNGYTNKNVMHSIGKIETKTNTRNNSYCSLDYKRNYCQKRENEEYKNEDKENEEEEEKKTKFKHIKQFFNVNSTIMDVGRITTPELMLMHSYFFKNCDILNSYSIGNYIINVKKTFEDNTLILHILSVTNFNNIFKNRKSKMKEIIILYNKRAHHKIGENKKYYYTPEFYTYPKDYLDYFIIGIIYYLKKNFQKSYLYFLYSLSMHSEFYFSFIFLFQLCLLKNHTNKKILFYHCLTLQPYNILPYLIYISYIITSFQKLVNKEEPHKHVAKDVDTQNKYDNYLNYIYIIINKAIYLDKENSFIYNELFVYHFLKKEFAQCEDIINEIFKTNNFLNSTMLAFQTVLYNMAVFYFYQKEIETSEKYLIKILFKNPYDLKSLHLLTRILFLKKNDIWPSFFDYSISVEMAFHSNKRKGIGNETSLKQIFLYNLKQTHNWHIIVQYYKIMKKKKIYFTCIQYIEQAYRFLFLANLQDRKLQIL